MFPSPTNMKMLLSASASGATTCGGNREEERLAVETKRERDKRDRGREKYFVRTGDEYNRHNNT